jgi:hypothetical protein
MKSLQQRRLSRTLHETARQAQAFFPFACRQTIEDGLAEHVLDCAIAARKFFPGDEQRQVAHIESMMRDTLLAPLGEIAGTMH